MQKGKAVSYQQSQTRHRRRTMMNENQGFKPGFRISLFIGDLLSGITEGKNNFRNTKINFIHR